jgi:TetR/AcrR family fatty acid metabolism transcriptional regulator
LVYRKTPKVQKKLDEREMEIIRAAREVLAEQSYHGSSIKAIAKKAGIAIGTFYLYFRNKESLFQSIVDEMFSELLSAMKEERMKYDHVLDKLRASMEACVRLFIKEETLAKILLVQIPNANHSMNNLLVEIEDELIKRTKEDLDEAVELGLIPEQDTYLSATAFVGSFRQLVISWLRTGNPQDLEQAFYSLYAYNKRGLGIEKS